MAQKNYIKIFVGVGVKNYRAYTGGGGLILLSRNRQQIRVHRG